MHSSPNHLINIACLLIIGYAIMTSASFLNPILLAIVFAIIIRPMLKALTKMHIPFFLALLIIIAGVSLVIAMIGGVISNTINQFNANIEFITATAISKLAYLEHTVRPLIEQLGIKTTFSMADLTQQFNPASLVSLIKSTLFSVTDLLSSSIFIFLTLIFLLIDADLLEMQMHKISVNNARRMVDVGRIFSSVSKYIETKFFISLVTALAVYILCIFMNVQFALMWSVLTLFFNFIPNIGVFIISAPMVLQAFILQDTSEATIFSLMLAIIHFLSGNVFEPRIMSKYLNLGTFVVWISLIFWNYLLGPVGMLLSIPLTTTCKIMLEMSHNYKNLALLLEGQETNDLPKSKSSSLSNLRRKAEQVIKAKQEKRQAVEKAQQEVKEAIEITEQSKNPYL